MTTNKYLSTLVIFGLVYLGVLAGGTLLGYGMAISSFTLIGLASYFTVLTLVYLLSRIRP